MQAEQSHLQSPLAREVDQTDPEKDRQEPLTGKKQHQDAGQDEKNTEDVFQYAQQDPERTQLCDWGFRAHEVVVRQEDDD